MSSLDYLLGSEILAQAIVDVTDLLQAASQSHAVDAIGLGDLLHEWVTGDRAFPAIGVLPAATLRGANGAYSAQTNRIYLSQEFVMQSDSPAIVGVLLEEAGHWLDAHTGAVDQPGDEGAIFSKLVQGENLSDVGLRFLQAEDDWATISIDGQSIAIEQADSYAGTNLNQLRDGLNQLLDSLQDALESQIFASNLPLVGTTLKNSASNAVQFITQLRTSLNDALDDFTTPTREQIRGAIADALNNLGVLPDMNGDGLKNAQDIEVLESTDNLQFSFQVGKNNASFSTPLSTDVGLPNLGLSIEGLTTAEIDYGFKLTFGMNQTNGFYLNTSASDELSLGLDLTTSGLTAEAKLGFLQFDATDQGTQFSGDFTIDLTDTNADNKLFLPELTAIGTNYQNLLDATLTGSADIKMGLQATTGIKSLPAINTDLEVRWDFGGAIVDPTQVLGNAPSVAFKNVELDLGSFLGDVVGPVLNDLKRVSQPIADALDPVTEPLPLIGQSLLDLAEKIAKAKGSEFAAGTIEFAKQFAALVDLLAAIPLDEDGDEIDLGDFNLGSTNLYTTSASSVDLSTVNTTRSTDIESELPTTGNLKAFLDALAQFNEAISPDTSGLALAATSSSDIGLQFPILEDPLSAVGLLLGSNKPIDFITYQTPEFRFDFPLDLPSVPIFGPIVLDFGGEANASAQLRFGYDSTGLQQFKTSEFKNPDKLANGFYISQPTGGNNLSLGGLITVGAGVGIGFLDLTVGGGIGLNVNFNVSDEADQKDGLDDNKARGEALTNPLCLFEPSGILSAIVFAALSIDLGFFSITKRFDLASVNLIEFTLSNGCDSGQDHYGVEDPDEINPQVRAALVGAGIIDRKGTAGGDVIEVRHLSGSKSGGDEQVRLFGLDPTPQDYEKVKLIVINGSTGDDRVEFTNGVEATGQLDGKEGNDTLIGGKGFDFLQGGAGNDVLNGAEGKDTAVYAEAPNGVVVNLVTGTAFDGYGTTDSLSNIENVEGSRHDDVLTATAGGSVLDAGAGNDRLFGGPGDDVLLGGVGADQMFGSGGTDTTTYLDSTAGVQVNLITGRGANGYASGDFLSGIENVHGSLFGDRLIGNALNNYLDGYAGDDNIVGATGADTLDGGDGIDWLSYRTSLVGVQVNLRTGSASGGDAAGDTLKFALLPNPIAGQPPIRATDLSSFENLEGSSANDVLEGDRGQNTISGLAGSDVLRGGDGNDTLIGGAGADSFDGGSGFDWADYSGSFLGATVNLQTGIGSGGDATGDTFVQSIPAALATVENLRGSNQADSLTGDIGSNDIAPGYSSFGIDTVAGGAAIDRLIIDYSNNAGSDVGSGLSGGYFSGSDNAGFISRNTSSNAAILDAVSFSGMERLQLIGTAFEDEIFSGEGDDLLVMGAGDDRIFGGRGSNSIFAGEGNDEVTDQNDRFREFGSVAAVSANNVINLDGGAGVDALSIDLRAETAAIVLESTNPQAESTQRFTSSNGAIAIRNFEYFRRIFTGAGNDRLTQLDRVDNDFQTNDGDDVVNPGLGFDLVDGGFSGNESGGDDVLILDYSVGDTGSGIRANLSNNNASFGGRYYRYTSEEGEHLLDEVLFENFERFQITGTSKADSLYGGFSDDVFYGNDGDDVISTGFGTDYVEAGDGNDFVTGDFGDDVLFGNAGDDLLTGNNGDDFVNAGSGNDRVFGDFGDDVLLGGDGDDVLLDRITQQFSSITASGGANTLDGGAGNDFLAGGINNDVLLGGTGDDTLVGVAYGDRQDEVGDEIDTLTGNAGADRFWLGDETFVYYDDGARSTPGLENYALITDFNATEGDVIQLQGSRSEYVLAAAPTELPTGIAIYRPEPIASLPSELIAIVQGATALSLDASYFTFV